MKLDVDREKVLKFLGYGKKKPPKIIEKKLDEELEVYDEYLEPKAYMKCLFIDSSKKNSIAFDKHTVIESSYLYENLKDMDKAYVVLYTVGKEIEEVIEKYSNEFEMMRAMIVDKIGVVALDNLRDNIVEEIESTEYPKVISSVSYPSQGDFKVEYQKILFDLFKDEDVEININEGSQFTPLKTVLLVYGIGEVKDTTDMCKACDNKCNKDDFS